MQKEGVPPFGNLKEATFSVTEKKRVMEFARDALWECYEKAKTHGYAIVRSEKNSEEADIVVEVCNELMRECKLANPPPNDSLVIVPYLAHERFEWDDMSKFGVKVSYSVKYKPKSENQN